MLPRALLFSLKIKRSLFFASFLLVAWGLILFLCTLGEKGGPFVQGSAFFFSLFLVQSVIAPAALVLMRLYLGEQNGKKVSLKKLFFSSLELVIISILLPLPLLILYLTFFLFLSLFLFLTWIPVLGHLFGIFLAFAPLVLNLGIVLLFVATFFLYTIFLPQISLDGTFDRKKTVHAIKQRVKKDPLKVLSKAVWAIVPLLLTALILFFAIRWTDALPFLALNPIERALQKLVIGIPVIGVLTPAFILFLHLCVEALVSDKQAKPLSK